LHDVGHGPFSHTFEGVQKVRGVRKKHETWSAEIIRSESGEIRPILEDLGPGSADKVADLLIQENPTDIYHAIVSSSFDADRLDYLRRDRQMTGTGAGAIDFDWLLEHVRVRSINLDAPDGVGDDDSPKVPTFCIDIKALPAAEQFLLARYTLHEQVYFHKTTRCIERMIAALLQRVADMARDVGTVKRMTGLDADHPIIRFFGSDAPTADEYLALDDIIMLGALERLALANDEEISALAKRLRNRNLYKTLDCRDFDRDLEWQAAGAKKVDKRFDLNGGRVIKDDGARLSIYTQIGGDEEKAHKKLRILDANKKTPEITSVGAIVSSLPYLLKLTRYYFADAKDRETAKALGARK
jgi:HD superfamily phosphohydrolase